MLGKFLRSFFLVDFIKGLAVTLKYTPQPAFTFQYPKERRPVAPRSASGPLAHLYEPPEHGAGDHRVRGGLLESMGGGKGTEPTAGDGDGHGSEGLGDNE